LDSRGRKCFVCGDLWEWRLVIRKLPDRCWLFQWLTISWMCTCHVVIWESTWIYPLIQILRGTTSPQQVDFTHTTNYWLCLGPYNEMERETKRRWKGARNWSFSFENLM
jgi:hypothetical protein